MTALLYSAFIAVLLPAFHYVLGGIQGVPPDSMPLRLLSAGISVAVAALLLAFPAVRRYATALQFVQVVAVLAVVDALIVDSHEQFFYVTSGLLCIIGAQNAFYSSAVLAAAVSCGFAFMAFDAYAAGIFWTGSNLITLAIYGSGYALAFIPASMRIRSQQSAVLSRLQAMRVSAELEEANAITHLGRWTLSLADGAMSGSAQVFEMLGLPQECAPGVLAGAYWSSIPDADRAGVEATLCGAGGAFTIDHRIVLPSGATRWVEVRGCRDCDETGTLVHIRGTMLDITARKEAELSLERLARYDALTSLPNRATMRELLRRTLEERPREMLSVFFIDLNGFKDVNDSLGHSYGDVLLTSVAQRLREALPKDTSLARWGGDEFVAVVPGAMPERAVRELCAQVRHEIAKPFGTEEGDLAIATTIGVARYPDHGSDPETLIRNADTAMYAAKGSDAGFSLFETSMHDAAVRRRQVQTLLRTALAENEFTLHYQPIVDASGLRLLGAESLLRWTDSNGVMHPPSEFIPIAEEIGAIVPIGRWVVEEAVRQAARWRDAGNPIPVAVNVSPRQLADPDFVGFVQRVLSVHRVEASMLELEITESALVPSADSIRMLAALRRLGIRLAVDDFGTGYSSFSYLKRLPLDALKIDRSFVEGVERHLDRSLVESIVSIGHTLGLQVTAEGIETAEQRRILANVGCDRLQGYLIGRPMSASVFDSFSVARAS